MKNGSVYGALNSLLATVLCLALLGVAVFGAFAVQRSALPVAALLIFSLLGLYSFSFFSKKASFLIVSAVVIALLFYGFFSQAEALRLS